MIKSKTNILFLWGVVCTILFGASFLVGVRWGVTGVAVSYSVIYLLISYFDFKIPFRFIGLSINEMLIKVKQPFFLGIGLGLLIGIIKSVLALLIPDKSISHLIILVLSTALYMIYFIRKNPELLTLIVGNKTYTAN